MTKFISLLVAVLALAPAAALADACSTPAVTHDEYRYQEQIDVDPRGGFESWQYIGEKTDWTTDTTVNGYAPDEKFSVGTWLKVTHRWHQTDQRTVEDSPATDTCGSSSGSSAASYGGGGGMCHPKTGYPECMKPANYRYFNLPVPFGVADVQFDTATEQKKILLTQVIALLLQQIQYLKTH